jgi:RimJ/RimL family protein N-acetyltransferase
MTVEIRLMTEADIASYHSCLDAVARERRYLSMLQAPPLEDSRAWVLPHIEQNHPFFVAGLGERVVGWCDITPQERECFRHRGTLGMGVHPDFRQRGIGTRLLRVALEHARTIGIERAELEVSASNHVARQLYERIGFTVEGTLRRARKSDDRFEDLLIMALFLKSHET